MENKPDKTPSVGDGEIKEIIVSKNTIILNNVAAKLGEFYASGKENEKLSSAQIRNILDRIQRMKKFDRDEIQLLRPALAYAAGRDKTGKLKHLQQILDKAIMQVKDENTFKNLRNFFEAIVAYHRYHGGK
ncbi:MAG: type III-A CRISPR-associated protein Csm2 [candidate division WOR-3 bacterium]|nr:type III-A CRISPR-associated protein Csm2 [candidate division WOR-3 bacterium]